MPETQPLVAIHFSLGAHTYKDVALLPQIRRQAENFWGPQGSNHQDFYWKEDKGTSESLIKVFSQFVADGEPLLDAYIQADHVRNPSLRRRLTPKELAGARRFFLLEDGGTGNMTTDSQIASALFLRREWVMLDEIGKSRQFEVIPEAYPDPIAKVRIQQERELYKNTSSILDQVKKGSINSQVLRLYREGMIASLATSNGERNAAFLDTMAERAQNAQETGKPTRIFVRIGALHFLLVERLKAQLPAASVTSQFDEGCDILLPEDRIILAFENDPKAMFPKEDWIKAVMSIYIDNVLSNTTMSHKFRRTTINHTLETSSAQELEALVTSLSKVDSEVAVNQFVASKR